MMDICTWSAGGELIDRKLQESESSFWSTVSYGLGWLPIIYDCPQALMGLAQKFEWTKVRVNKYFTQIIFLFQLMKKIYDE